MHLEHLCSDALSASGSLEGALRMLSVEIIIYLIFFSSNCPIRCTEQWNSADTPRYDFTKRIHYKLNKKPELSAKLLPCGGLLKGTTLPFVVCVCPPFKRQCGADRGLTELHLMSCMSIPEPPPTILYPLSGLWHLILNICISIWNQSFGSLNNWHEAGRAGELRGSDASEEGLVESMWLMQTFF